MPSNVIEHFKTDDQKWNAVRVSDPLADGVFWYGVTSTRIVCKPSCLSRIPKRQNVKFFDEVQVAINKGFRQCKRCKP